MRTPNNTYLNKNLTLALRTNLSEWMGEDFRWIQISKCLLSTYYTPATTSHWNTKMSKSEALLFKTTQFLRGSKGKHSFHLEV